MNEWSQEAIERRLQEHIDKALKQKERVKAAADRAEARASGKSVVSGVANVSDVAELESGHVLLGEVETYLARFIIYPSEHARVAHVLWIGHTHLMDVWDSTPRIAFLSPEPASGKTRALEVSELLVPSPVEAINVSPAYLFRKVGEGTSCTILFDEIDTVFGPKAKENEEIRGLLNAGHRQGAVAGRCVVHGKTVRTEEISAYSAVALAGLGWLPDTILSRSVIIRMRRRKPGEKVTPFRRRTELAAGTKLKDRLARWAECIAGTIDWPDMPAGIEDRDADVWEALIAVAVAAGGDWPARASAAAQALIKEARDVEPSLGIRLLGDLRTIFGNAEHIFTEAILAALHGIPEAPWNDLKGKPLNDRGLALRLRQYSIKSKQIRIGDVTRKGYSRADFHDAWQAYVTPLEASVSETGETNVTGHENPNGSRAKPVSDGEQVSETDPQTSETFATTVSDSPCNVSDDVSDDGPKNIRAINDVSHVSDVSLVREADRDDDGLSIPECLDQRPRCAQCRGRPDGTERPVTVNGEAVWLHDECRRFYRPEGRSFRPNTPMAFMRSSA